MEVGDKLYCKEPYGFKITKNKAYEVLYISYFIIIKDDNGNPVTLLFSPRMDRMFYSKKELRKIKIDKIYETS